MKKIIIPFMLAFTSSMANAEYLIKIPLEQVQGGHLPNKSIVFVGSTEVAPETPVKHEPVDCLTNPTDNPQLCEERLTAWEQFVSDNNLDNDYNWNHIAWEKKGLSYIPNEPYPTTSANYLTLGNNQLKNVDGLSNLTNVGSLTLTGNPLENVDGLSNLKTANHLTIGSSELTNLNGLSNLTVALTLSLASNQLKNVDGLSNLKTASIIYLQNNQLTNVDGLINLKSVDTLKLHNNQLENVNGLANLTVINWITIDATYSGPKLEADTIFCTVNTHSDFTTGYARKSDLCQ